MNSIKLQSRMDTIFMNSENTKASDLHRLLLNLSDKINLKKRWICYFIKLSIYYAWKNITKSYKNNKSKLLALTWNEEFAIPKDILSISSKNMRQLLIIVQ